MTADRRIDLPFRECVPCRLWTQCGVCPSCYARLGPPPFAAAVLPEQFDFAVYVPLGEGPRACSHCRLRAPFHRTRGCPGGAARLPKPAPSNGSTSSFPKGGKGSSKSVAQEEYSHA